MAYAPITEEQAEALVEYARQNGRTWKSQLNHDWRYARSNAVLHGLRNSHGPRWLVGFELKVSA